jgi:hypothetical protein
MSPDEVFTDADMSGKTESSWNEHLPESLSPPNSSEYSGTFEIYVFKSVS